MAPKSGILYMLERSAINKQQPYQEFEHAARLLRKYT